MGNLGISNNDIDVFGREKRLFLCIVHLNRISTGSIGPVAQLVEHFICNEGVTSSSLVRSTKKIYEI